MTLTSLLSNLVWVLIFGFVSWIGYRYDFFHVFWFLLLGFAYWQALKKVESDKEEERMREEEEERGKSTDEDS